MQFVTLSNQNTATVHLCFADNLIYQNHNLYVAYIFYCIHKPTVIVSAYVSGFLSAVDTCLPLPNTDSPDNCLLAWENSELH